MSDDRSLEQIQADIEATRAELQQSVSLLVDRVHPKNQVAAAKQGAKDAASSVGESIKAFGRDVKSGEPKALAIVGAGVAVVGLTVFASVRAARS